MIFYFSGTGNCKAVAKTIATALGDTAQDIIGDNPLKYRFTANEYVGIVFPVYAWAAPPVVQNFIKQLNIGDAFSFGIATHSTYVGEALRLVSDDMPLKASYSLKMPDNYPITDHIIDDKESSMKKLVEAKPCLDNIIQRLLAKEEAYEVMEGENAHERTYKISFLFNADPSRRSTKPYRYTDEKCIGCGACEKMCPANVIRMENNRPVWAEDSCYHCMACLNRCPADAIEYGAYSEGRFRYYFKGFDPANY